MVWCRFAAKPTTKPLRAHQTWQAFTLLVRWHNSACSWGSSGSNKPATAMAAASTTGLNQARLG